MRYKQNQRVDPQVAVIVISHNYGKFLKDALQSVMTQAGVQETLVIDDSSTDDTADVAADFPVDYLRHEAGCPHESRRLGFHNTTAPVVMFLDADDRLGTDYVRTGLRALQKTPDAVIAHTDLFLFGARQGRLQLRGGLIERANFIHGGAMFLREPMAACGVMDGPLPDSKRRHSDWWLWRNLLHAGGKSVWFPAKYYYRKHGASLSDGRKADKDTLYCRDLTPLWEAQSTASQSLP